MYCSEPQLSTPFCQGEINGGEAILLWHVLHGQRVLFIC